MRRPRASTVLKAAVVLSVAALVVATACDALTVPGKDCNGTDMLEPDSGKVAPLVESCSSCLSQNCCDAVGRCQENDECKAAMRSAHRCIQETPLEEPRCVQALPPLTQTLYQCMRSKCAAPSQCSVPSCNVDPAAVLFHSPLCDRCVINRCCDRVNACYQNRRCKLIAECIVERCLSKPDAGAGGFGEQGPNADNRKNACEPYDASADGGDPSGNGPPDCVRDCFDEHATNIGGERDDVQARCRAFELYACVATDCRGECFAAPAVGEEAGSADAPVEPPNDASTDAPKD